MSTNEFQRANDRKIEALRLGARGIVQELVALHTMARIARRSTLNKKHQARLVELSHVGRELLEMQDPMVAARERAATAEANYQRVEGQHRALRVAVDRTMDTLRGALIEDRNRHLDERSLRALIRGDKLDVLVRLLREQRDMARASREHAETKTSALEQVMNVEDAERPPVAMSASAAEPPFWRTMKDRHAGLVDLNNDEATVVRRSLRSGMNELMHAAERVEVGRDGSMRFTMPASWAIRDVLEDMGKALGDIGITIRKATKATKSLVDALTR